MRCSDSSALDVDVPWSILSLTKRNQGHNIAKNSRLVLGFVWSSELPSRGEDVSAGIGLLNN